MKRWSKLRSRVEGLFVPQLDLQLHLSMYRMASQRGSHDVPRYWLALGKEILWDYPRDFQGTDRVSGEISFAPGRYEEILADLDDEEREWLEEEESRYGDAEYPYINATSWISILLRRYTDAPLPGLIDREFPLDRWNLTDLLKIADRRLGKRKLSLKYAHHENSRVRRILEVRLALKEQP
jgi:hypothetical protein